MTRVCILTSVHPALDTRIFHKQARTLAAAGYEVLLFGRHRRDERLDGVQICALPDSLSRWKRPLLWWRILLGALSSRANIYHIHDPELLPLALLLRWLTGRPVIYDAHEYYGDEVQTRQWIPASLRQPAGWLTERVEKAIARRFAAVVTVNEQMNALFLRVQPHSVAVHNYPPVEYFTPPPAGPREQLVVYAGTLTVDRGLETIYQAGRLLRARYPDLEIIVAGPVDWAGIDPAVPRDRHRWGQDAGVHFLGTLPPRQVPALLQRASVGWIPFQATPNNIRATPIKLLEYMAAELPVVASDLDGMRAIITVAGSGLLARAADASSHAEAIAWLLEHPSEVLSMGERGRRSVLERYTWASEGEKLVGLYEEVGGRK